MVAPSSSVVNVYPLSSYSFGTKEPKMEKDTSVADRLARIKFKVVESHLRITIALTVQSIPSASSENGTYEQARKSSIALAGPFPRAFLEEPKVEVFLEEPEAISIFVSGDISFIRWL